MPKPSVSAGLPALSSTLLIPLAARAHGDRLFPQLALGDNHAAAALKALRADITPYLEDRASVFGIMARATVLRQLAEDFFTRHPRSLGVNLGCGFSHYFQWLDSGHNRWLDADLPEVIALRERVLGLHGKARYRQQACDLRDLDWWDALGLPPKPEGPPVVLMSEGVLMYFEPVQVEALIREFAERAPPRSQLLFDAMCWLAIGQARLHPSVRHTGAEFRWGLRSVADLALLHPRLVVRSEHALMEGYGWPYSVIGPSLRWFTGAPFYGAIQLEVPA